MKIKKLILDTIVIMASISLISCIVIVLSHNLMAYGVVSFSFDTKGNSLNGFMESMADFNSGLTVGTAGFLGILIGVLSIGIPCAVAFYQTKNKHHFMWLGFAIPLLFIFLPQIIKGNTIINLLGSMALLLYVNPFYSLLSVLPFGSMGVNVIVGYAIVTLLVVISTVAGIVFNKLKVNLD